MKEYLIFTFGTKEVDSSDPMSVQDITFAVPKEQAASLRKDSSIEFKGTISSVLSVLGSVQVSLKDAKIL